MIPIAIAFAKSVAAIAFGRITGSKTTLVATLCLAGAVGYAGWLKFVHDPKVSRRAIQKIERKADAVIQKSVSAQRSVSVDGAAVRLRQRYCADC